MILSGRPIATWHSLRTYDRGTFFSLFDNLHSGGWIISANDSASANELGMHGVWSWWSPLGVSRGAGYFVCAIAGFVDLALVYVVGIEGLLRCLIPVASGRAIAGP